MEADGGEEEDRVAPEDDRGEDEEEHRAAMASALEPVRGAEGGEDEGEDVGEGAAGVEEEVELRGGEQREGDADGRSERGAQRAAESTERGHHERGERESRRHLRGHAGAPRVVAHAERGEGRAERRGRPRQSDGAHEGARHDPGEDVMVVRRELAPVHQNVVRRLQVEALLHLGVRRQRHVRRRHGEQKRVQREAAKHRDAPGAAEGEEGAERAPRDVTRG